MTVTAFQRRVLVAAVVAVLTALAAFGVIPAELAQLVGLSTEPKPDGVADQAEEESE